MTGFQYLILAYVLGLAILLGYAAKMCWECRAVNRSERNDSQ